MGGRVAPFPSSSARHHIEDLFELCAAWCIWWAPKKLHKGDEEWKNERTKERNIPWKQPQFRTINHCESQISFVVVVFSIRR